MSVADQAIFKAKLKGDFVRLKMPYFKAARTRLVIKLWQNDIIDIESVSVLNGSADFLILEKLALQHCFPRLQNWLRGWSVLFLEPNEKVVFEGLDLEMLGRYAEVSGKLSQERAAA